MQIVRKMMKDEKNFEVKNWNTDCLNEDKIEKVNKCFDACGLKRLSDDNIEFLIEYCKVVENKN